MKVMLSAAILVALSALGAPGPAAARDFMHTDIPKSPREPQEPKPPRAPGETERDRGFRGEQPFKPYEGVKPMRHYNIYTGKME